MTAEPQLYAYCGLRLRSALELHLPPAPDGEWDVDISWGPDLDGGGEPLDGDVVAVYEMGGTAWYTATVTEDGYRLRFRDCGDFVVSNDLSRVEVRRDPAGRVDLLAILMAGTVSAFLLTLRGNTVLHASSVAIDGAALAFVGQSGRGKSTVAALLCAHGAQLVTDDVLIVDPGPPVMCVGGAAELRLRPAARAIAQARPDAKTRATADDRLALGLPSAPPEPHPLAAIAIPRPSRTACAVEVRRLAPSEALVALLSFPRIHGWRLPDVLRRDLATLSEVVSAVPVYDVTIPWGPPFSPSVAGAVAALADGSHTIG